MQVALDIALEWSSRLATHVDRTWCDAADASWLPGEHAGALERTEIGAPVCRSFAAGELVPGFDPALRTTIDEIEFRRIPIGGTLLEPRVGRFYPGNLLARLPPGLPLKDRRPFRCVGRAAGSLAIDLNHPLASIPLQVSITRRQALRPGGTLPRRFEPLQHAAAGGPGMQAALNGADTDFSSAAAFAREDDADDGAFYAGARLTDHLDTAALDRVRDFYGRFLRPGMAVLDLMASVNSHIAAEVTPLELTGLGMNRTELLRNPRLTERVVHDLNRDPALPFSDGRFEAVLCTVSVEYVVHPVEVFREVRRVLRAGAPFLIAFSDRWFPPKVIRIWTELHPFERLGLVLDWLRQSGGFAAVRTESFRGLPRPLSDKYASITSRSDPIFCVWGWAT
jgi:SAM-dependent methyltransferase